MTSFRYELVKDESLNDTLAERAMDIEGGGTSLRYYCDERDGDSNVTVEEGYDLAQDRVAVAVRDTIDFIANMELSACSEGRFGDYLDFVFQSWQKAMEEWEVHKARKILYSANRLPQ